MKALLYEFNFNVRGESRGCEMGEDQNRTFWPSIEQ